MTDLPAPPADLTERELRECYLAAEVHAALLATTILDRATAYQHMLAAYVAEHLRRCLLSRGVPEDTFGDVTIEDFLRAGDQ